MKNLTLSVIRELLFVLSVLSLLSAITPIGLRPFPSLAVAIAYLNIVLLIAMSVFYLGVASSAKTDPTNLLKLVDLGKPYKWISRTMKSVILFILFAWAGYTFLAVVYAISIMLYRAIEHGTRQDYQKYLEDKAL